MSSNQVQARTYAERAARHNNPAAKSLLETIERKKSNLCVSVDVTDRNDLLKIIDIVGPYVCLVKVRDSTRCLPHSLTFHPESRLMSILSNTLIIPWSNVYKSSV